MLWRKHTNDKHNHLKRAGMNASALRSAQALVLQQGATTAKEAALEQEARAKTLSTYIETVRKFVPMVALSYGLVISFVYFFVVIGFYPTGLTVGDTLFYVFIAFGHGLLSVFTVLAGVAVVTPVMVFDAGAQRVGIRPKTLPGRGVMVFAPFISPMLIAATVMLAQWAFGDEAVSSHALQIFLGITAAALLIGVFSHFRAWQLGKSLANVAGCPGVEVADKQMSQSDSWGDWFPLGLANALAFGLLYAGLILIYDTRAIAFLLASACSGFIAWVVIELAFDEDQALKEKWQMPEQVAWLNKLEWKLRLSVPATAATVLFAWLLGLGIKHGWIPFLDDIAHLKFVAFAIASVALIIYLILVVRAPIGEILIRPRQDNQPEVFVKSPAYSGKKAKPWPMLVSIAFVAFTVPLVADVAYLDQNMSKSVFRALGVRAENTTIRVGRKSLTAIEAVARNTGVDLSVCLEPDGYAEVFPVTVLWHGLGKRSLVGVGLMRDSPEGKPQPIAQLELNSDDVRLLRNQGGQCRDIEQNVHFKSGKTEPVDGYEKSVLIKEMSDVLDKGFPAPHKDAGTPLYWSLEGVIVTGDADPMPLGEAGNEQLAHRRAACLADAIAPLVLSRAKELKQVPYMRWYGEGARSPTKTSCPLDGNRQALMECHTANRLARVRLMFSCKDSKDRPARGCLSPEPVEREAKAVKTASAISGNVPEKLLQQVAEARSECNGETPQNATPSQAHAGNGNRK